MDDVKYGGIRFAPAAAGAPLADVVRIIGDPTDAVGFMDRHGQPATAALGYSPTAETMLLVMFVGVGNKARVFHVGEPTAGEMRRLFSA